MHHYNTNFDSCHAAHSIDRIYCVDTLSLGIVTQYESLSPESYFLTATDACADMMHGTASIVPGQCLRERHLRVSFEGVSWRRQVTHKQAQLLQADSDHMRMRNSWYA